MGVVCKILRALRCDSKESNVLDNLSCARRSINRITLEQTLSLKRSKSDLIAYMKKLHCEELVYMYDKINQYKSADKNAEQLAQDIYARFIKVGAIDEVNLEGRVRKEVEDRINRKEYQSNLFFEVETSILRDLNGVFSVYIQTGLILYDNNQQ
ncbi:regulator of G-protein signaling [Acrasis kona]|uniref:Regulator of G-protein signaling n=1 Tax=Acrasis kona TaxID=1008807 RepID=A0AAW2ZHU9_9EUKA